MQGNSKEKKQALIAKTSTLNCMKESNFHNIANAKPILQIAKRKTGAWISHRRIRKGTFGEASCWQQ